MKKSKYDLGGLTALKDKIQGANPFPDLTKNERDAVMEAYTDGAIKEDGGLIDDVPPMEVRNINLWLNNYSKYIPKESVKFSNLVPISLDNLNIKMSRVDRKEQQLENLLKQEPKAKTEADIDGSRIMDGRVIGGRGHWEGAVKDGFQVYNNEQQYIMESTIKDFAMVLNNAEVWIESTDEYRDLEEFVKHYNIFLDHIKENPKSKEAEFLNKKEKEEPKEEPIEEEPFVPRVERSGKWDESYSILCDELATYKKGGKVNSQNFDGYIITKFEAPLKYNYENDWKIEIINPHSHYYRKRSGGRELDAYLNSSNSFDIKWNLVWSMVNEYGGKWVFESEKAHPSAVLKQVVIIDTTYMRAKGGNIPMNIKFFDSKGKVKEEKEVVEKITFGKDPFADTRVREKTLDEIREEMLRSDSQITRELAYETAPFVYGLQGLNDEEVARYMGYEDVAEQKREEQKQDAEWEDIKKNFKEYFYKEYNGMQVNSVEFAGVVDIDGKNKTIKRIYDEKVFRPSKAKLKALEQEIFEDYEKGGVLKTEIDEYGGNIPKPLQEVFDQFDEDADAYVEAERLRMKANEIGYDFDYGLSGEPTDFWKISDNYKKGGYVSWKDKYNKKYGYEKGKSHSLKEVSKDTKVSMKGLQKIYDKGVGARKTNPQSVRSVSDGKKRGGKSLKGKMSAEQWAMARVYSSVMGGKASKVDAKELKMAKGGSIKRNANSPLLKYVNFEDGWSINLKKLNLYTNQNGKKYKSKNKYGISRQGGKDKDIWEFETLNEAKIKYDELVELGKTYSKIRNQGDVDKNYAKGGSTSKKSCYTKELKYKDGGMIFTFEEGGEISDTCYVNYEGYQIQSTRCKREGITYFMIGEYPEVAKALYKNYTSEWIYYNRLARLFISPETAKQFIQEASKYFNPIVPIEPYFLDVDRSFATYSVRDTRPFQDVPISVSVGKSTTARKLGDKIQERKREEIRLKRIETLKTQGKPFFKEDDYRKAEGKYWAISTIISLGGEGDWGDDKWKNAITRENIPYDNGISLMTLIHEYAHCLDFNQSIAKGRIYERPIYELELLSGRNSIGQKFSSQEMMSMREAQQSGQKRTTLLSNHKEYFIQALSDILRGGMSNGIPILNEIENEAHEIEKRVGGKAYADEQRKKVQEDFLLKMQKTIEKANKPSLSVKFPTQLKEYLSRTSANYILQLSQKEIDKKVGTELLPHISNFKDVVRENMAFNPTENAKLLKDLRKIEKDIKRLQERT